MRLPLLVVLLVVSSLLSLRVAGQSAGPYRSSFDRKVTPPSPEAAQLGVFGSAPPDLQTGAVQTTIPLMTAKSRQLSLPVTLNYHYTGLIVDELPSWVGLGWTLAVGGVVTRTVQGLPDEHYLNTGLNQLPNLRRLAHGADSRPVAITLGGSSQYHLLTPFATECENAASGAVDSEPDSYTISTPVYSGKLIIDSVGVVTCSPRADIRFTFSVTGGLTMTTGDGTRYTYDAAESSYGVDESYADRIPTAWYLTEIVSPDGKDHIQLTYTGYGPANATLNPYPDVPTFTQAAFQPANAPIEQTNCSGNHPSYNYVLPSVTQTTRSTPQRYTIKLRLTTITTATQEITLSVASRDDIALINDWSAQRLTRLTCRDLATQQVLSRVDFSYDYFNNSPGSSPKAKRLRLTAVQEAGKPAYGFRYYGETNTPFPSRDSFAKDHWGYFNGPNGQNNSTLMPLMSANMALYQNLLVGRLANRTPHGASAQLGALQKIQYPTGGWSSFAYEPNLVTAGCDLEDRRAEMGGSNIDGLTYYTARAEGTDYLRTNRSYQHDSLEQYYADRYNYITVNVDGAMFTNPGPENVDIQTIDSPYGFTLTNIEYIGNACTSPFLSNCGSNCIISAFPNVKATLYLLNQGTGIPRPWPFLGRLDAIATANYGTITTKAGGANGSMTCVTSNSCTGCAGTIMRDYPPGKYYLVADVNSGNPSSVFAEMRVTVYQKPAPVVASGGTSSHCYEAKQVGGIRLLQSRDYAGTGDTLTKTYRYRESAQPGALPSGKLFVTPDYAYLRGRCGNNAVVAAFNVGKSNWLDAGYHVGYSRVEVESNGRQAGTTVYYYLNSTSYGQNCRNLVTRIDELDNTGTLVKQTTNQYDMERVNASPGFRLSLEYDKMQDGPGGGGRTLAEKGYTLTPRNYSFFWPKLVRTTEKVFSTAGTGRDSLQTSTSYAYLARGTYQSIQPVRTTKDVGGGRKSLTITRYPGQYFTGLSPTNPALTGSAKGLADLVDRGMIGVPVEHQTWVRTGADSAVIGGDVTHFADYRPARVFALATAAPIPAAQFQASGIQTSGIHNGKFTQDPHYIERVAFTAYSPFGNLRQQQQAKALPSSYLWGYPEEARLLAETANAPYAAVAFTSFEDGAPGRLVYDPAAASHRVLGGRTGRWAYRLNGGWGVSLDSLAAGDYELLLWAQSSQRPEIYRNGTILTDEKVASAANGWNQYRVRLRFPAGGNFNIDATPNAPILLDEVRLHPIGARMDSYTYDVAGNVTSHTDPSGRTLTYEYDALDRLIRTRDEQGHILSQQQYHYAQH